MSYTKSELWHVQNPGNYCPCPGKNQVWRFRCQMEGIGKQVPLFMSVHGWHNLNERNWFHHNKHISRNCRKVRLSYYYLEYKHTGKYYCDCNVLNSRNVYSSARIGPDNMKAMKHFPCPDFIGWSQASMSLIQSSTSPPLGLINLYTSPTRRDKVG